jgi:hypothetical protein
MNSAVSTGFSTIATVTAISVSPPARLSTMMLLPLPGICGIQIEQAPVSNPANPTVTRRVHEAAGDLGCARRISPLKPVPTAAATGISATVNSSAVQLYSVSGHTKVGSPWLTGHAVTVAMHDVATATSTATGRQLLSTMPQAYRAPAAGTL